MSEPDVFAELDSATLEHEKGEESLRAALREQWEKAESRLARRKGTTFSDENHVLQAGYESNVVGHFYFSDAQIKLAWNNDMEAALDPDPDGPTYEVIAKADELPYAWLRAIVESRMFELFLGRLATHLREEARGNADRATAVRSISSRPAASLSNELADAARPFGYELVQSQWRAAQAEAHSNPDRAIALACTLIETTGQHVLSTLGCPPPSDKSIQGVLRAVSDAFGLDPAKQAESHLKKLCGALSTIAASIGELRTRHSEAHGHMPGTTSLERTQAVLAVNSAGVLVTFLMNRLREHASPPTS